MLTLFINVHASQHNEHKRKRKQFIYIHKGGGENGTWVPSSQKVGKWTGHDETNRHYKINQVTNHKTNVYTKFSGENAKLQMCFGCLHENSVCGA